MRRSFLLLLSCAFTLSGTAQNRYNIQEFVDINNVKAPVLVHGDLWSDTSASTASCEFPKNTNKHVGFGAGLWLSGYENSNLLHISACVYRNGVDYWPGPLNSSGSTDAGTIDKWAKIWKVEKTEIDAFAALSSHTVGNTPPSILRWPGKGNVHATGNNNQSLQITEDMAPFLDFNSNGIYEPLLGEHPAMKGDQMLWWVINDNGPLHNKTNGLPLKVQVEMTAYAYKRNTLIDNVIYYEYKIKNKSGINYTGFRLGKYADFDIGLYSDDYLGCDTNRRIAYCYNGDAQDGPSTYGYNFSPPAAGITIIQAPGDMINHHPLGSVTTFFFGSTSGISAPLNDEQFNNYMRSKWRDGNHVVNDFQSQGVNTNGYVNIGPPIDFIFPGNPSIGTEWSECSSNNPPGDRRLIISTTDFTLNAGQSATVLTALIVIDTGTNNNCSNFNLAILQEVCDTAWGNVAQPLAALEKVRESGEIYLYPNPCRDELHMPLLNADAKVAVFDMLGRTVEVKTRRNNGEVLLLTSQLVPGIYCICTDDGIKKCKAQFVKE